jgi:hypothetical protein
MTRTRIARLLALANCALLACAALGQAPRPALAQNSQGALLRIEKYKAPKYPASLHLDRETYDYRIRDQRPVPATLTDVFICDIWQRVEMDLKRSLKPEDVTDEIIARALKVYLERHHDNIAGYRPWTHWNFIRKLSEPERQELAAEIVSYIKKNGVRDVEN